MGKQSKFHPSIRNLMKNGFVVANKDHEILWKKTPAQIKMALLQFYVTLYNYAIYMQDCQ